MFFGPKLPLTTFEKVAIEMDIQRMADQFGVEHLRSQQVLFSDDASLGLHSLADEDGVVALSDRIAAIFDTNSDAVGIEFGEADDWTFDTAIGHDDRQVVAQMRRDLLEDPVRVATHLAASYSSYVLKENGKPESDCESLHESVAIWHGFGPLMAEGAVRTNKSMDGGWEQWGISKLGQLSAIQIGYAMSVQAYLLGDGLPAWQSKLSIDAKDSMAKGYKYLAKTNDCLVDESDSCLHWNRAQCEQNLKSRFGSHRLMALYQFPANSEALDEHEESGTLGAINDKDLSVRRRAYQLLEFAPSSTEEVVRAIEIGFDDHDIPVKASAFRASAIHGHAMEDLAPRLRYALKSNDREVMVHVATALAANELVDDESLRILLDSLKVSLVRGNDDATTLLRVLKHVHDDAEQLIMSYFENDEDLKNSARHLLIEPDRSGGT